jgi:hypothetical protein
MALKADSVLQDFSLPTDYIKAAFPKLWSSGSALVVLLDSTLVQKRQKKSN